MKAQISWKLKRKFESLSVFFRNPFYLSNTSILPLHVSQSKICQIHEEYNLHHQLSVFISKAKKLNQEISKVISTYSSNSVWWINVDNLIARKCTQKRRWLFISINIINLFMLDSNTSSTVFFDEVENLKFWAYKLISKKGLVFSC